MAFNKNPWMVESIESFSFYCCPECVFRSKEETFFQAHALQNHSQSTSLFHNYDTKCEMSDSEEQTVSEVAGIKEEQLEVDIKIEHAGDGEQNFEDFEAENSDVDSVKEELSDDDNYQENEVSDRKKSPQEFCGRCKKNISKSLFTSHLESCHPNNEDFQVITSILKILGVSQI